jgi:hypothetical protein
MTHDSYPTQPAWATGEVSPTDAQYVREELSSVPFLTPAFKDLGSGLVVGSSRTVYNLPVNQFPRDGLDAMLSAARAAAEVIYREGLDGIDPASTPLDMHVDEVPEQFDASALPDGAKARMSPDSPIGYMRMESANTGLKASVGALDPRTQTHYSVPLN